MFEMWKSIIVVVFLGYFSVEDIRKRELNGLPVMFAGLIGIFLTVTEGACRDWHVVFRFLPGLICLGLGWLTGEEIGYGDGLMLLCLGCFLSLSQLLSVCLSALTLAGITAVILILVFRKGRKTEIPFVPFLLAGYGISLLGQGGGQIG